LGYDKNNYPLWKFCLEGFPHNCGIVISGDAWVHPIMRNRGLGTYLRSIKDEICRRSGFTTVRCTTVQYNEAQVHILEKDGWRQIHTFVNKRTDNTCIEWAKDL
jgi:GNAT superfamily N-acetyltransferase